MLATSTLVDPLNHRMIWLLAARLSHTTLEMIDGGGAAGGNKGDDEKQ